MNQDAVQTLVKNASSPVLLENLIDSDNKICRLKKLIDWRYLDNELGHFFGYEHASSSRLILGLLYLQSIDNLPYSDVISIWKKSPEWQYFCGEAFLSETYPLNNASLAIWSRIIGEQGRLSMTRALINGPKATLH